MNVCFQNIHICYLGSHENVSLKLLRTKNNYILIFQMEKKICSHPPPSTPKKGMYFVQSHPVRQGYWWEQDQIRVPPKVPLQEHTASPKQGQSIDLKFSYMGLSKYRITLYLAYEGATPWPTLIIRKRNPSISQDHGFLPLKGASRKDWKQEPEGSVAAFRSGGHHIVNCNFPELSPAASHLSPAIAPREFLKDCYMLSRRQSRSLRCWVMWPRPLATSPHVPSVPLYSDCSPPACFFTCLFTCLFFVWVF